VHQGDKSGILAEGAWESVISDNRVKYVAGHGIELANVIKSFIYGNNIIFDSTHTDQYDGILLRASSQENVIVENRIVSEGAIRYAIYEGSGGDKNIIAHNQIISGTIHKTGANTFVKHNRGYTTESSGTATITGDGVTTEFTVDVTHGLVSDKLACKIACKKDATYKWYLVDTDADGTYETIRIVVTFATAPASGETVEIYWSAEVV